MNGFAIVGIDPSLTGTAVASDVGVKRLSSKSIPTNSPALRRVERYERLVAQVLNAVELAPAPRVIFLEGYAFSKNASAAKFIAEFGGILRWHLVDACDHLFEVAPTSLKAFTCHGRAKKDDMKLAAFKRWAVEFDTDDEVDAYALYRFGRVAAKIDQPDNAKQAKTTTLVVGNELEPIPF